MSRQTKEHTVKKNHGPESNTVKLRYMQTKQNAKQNFKSTDSRTEPAV